MIEELKPYSEYRDAEGRWLGRVPSHWRVRRLKYLLRERDTRSSSGREQLLRVSQYTGVTKRQRADGLEEPDTRAESLVGYKIVQPQDLVINIMLAWNGSMGVSLFDGIASPAYCVYKFAAEAHPWFYHSLLRCPIYKQRIKAMSTGVVESRLRLYSDDLFRIEALLPPPEEQAAIVRFLDHANGRLERAIRAKRKVIALLNEQKQAIIHRAVTRGLDPKVPLKPSGLNWLGDIPTHWGIERSKVLFRERKQTALPNDVQLSATQAYGVIPQAEYETMIGRRVVKISMHLDKRKHVEMDDFVISMRSFEGGIERAWTSGAIRSSYVILIPGPNIGVGFFTYLLKSPGYIQALRQTADFIRDGQDLNFGNFTAVSLPVIPLDEQRAIAKYLDYELKPLKPQIARLEREIALLREYRTRLVADVVTGQLDVRPAAARLPAISQESAPTDALVESPEEEGVEA